MSRSYKKMPVFTTYDDCAHINWYRNRMKRIASRRVRHTPIDMTDALNNGGYRRCMDNNSVRGIKSQGPTYRQAITQPEIIEENFTQGMTSWRQLYYNK